VWMKFMDIRLLTDEHPILRGCKPIERRYLYLRALGYSAHNTVNAIGMDAAHGDRLYRRIQYRYKEFKARRLPRVPTKAGGSIPYDP
jgi:hypothetical protein